MRDDTGASALLRVRAPFALEELRISPGVVPELERGHSAGQRQRASEAECRGPRAGQAREAWRFGRASVTFEDAS